MKRKTNFFLFSALLLSFLPAKAQLPDSIMAKVDTVKGAKNQAIYLQKLADGYGRDYPLLAYNLRKESINIGTKLKDSDLIADALLANSNFYISNQQYDSARYLIKRAFEYYKTEGDRTKMGKASSQLSVTYYYQSDFDNSIRYMLEASRLLEGTADSITLAGVYNNLGSFYQRFYDDYDQALIFFQKAYYLKMALGDTISAMRTLSNIGGALTGSGKVDSGIQVLRSVIPLRQRYQDQTGLSITYSNIGAGFLEIDKTDSAIYYVKKALQIDRQLKDNYGLNTDLYWLSKAYFQAGEYGAAIETAKESIDLAEDLVVKSELLKILSDSYAALGQNTEALRHLQEFLMVKDTLYNKDQQQTIAELETKYETERKEQEIKLLENEKKLTAIQLARSENQRLFFLIAAALLLVVVVLVFFQFRQRNKYAKVVEEKNEQLSELMSAKQKVFGVIAHDLKNPLSAFSNMSSTLADNIDAFSKEEIRVFLEKFVKSSEDLRDLLNNLLQWSLTETGLLKVRSELFNIAVLADLALLPLQDYATAKGIQVIVDLPDAMIQADRKMVETIIRNLISNALKFTDKGGEVKLGSISRQDELVIEVADTGIGMEESQLADLFDIQKDVSRIGDHEGKGTGLGLLLCKELVDKMGGRIWAKSRLHEGTSFYFGLPTA